MKNLKTFEEIQTSMDFTGNLSQEIMGRLNDAKDFFVKNLEETEEVEQTTKGIDPNWKRKKWQSGLEFANGLLDGSIELNWKNHVDLADTYDVKDYAIFRWGNSDKVAEAIGEIINKYKDNEVKSSSVPAAGGWSGTMRSTVGGGITPVVNYTYRAGYYGFDRNILIGVQVGGGIDREIRDKIFQEFYEVLFPYIESNQRDGGVSLFTSLDGTNWTMMGLSCSKFSFNRAAADRLRNIINSQK